MSRLHRADRSVHVKCASGRPEQFIWRDRLYRVNEVLQQWERTSVWWKDVRTTPTGADVQTWRVEASAGRCDRAGVYDLSFDPTSDQWYLIRTFD